MFEMVEIVAKLSVELCQLFMVPLYPERVIVPEFELLHCTVLGPTRIPPMDTPFTETVNIPEVVEAQTPFWTTA